MVQGTEIDMFYVYAFDYFKVHGFVSTKLKIFKCSFETFIKCRGYY